MKQNHTMAFAYLQSLCSPDLSDVEDPYIQAYMDERLGRPNPFRQPIRLQQTILEFLRQTPQRQIPQRMNQAVLNDEDFSLNK